MADPPTLVGGRADATGDAGTPDPELWAALAAWRVAPTATTTARVYAALLDARLFAPVTARLEETGTDPGTGLAVEKRSSTVLVTPVSAAGATAVAVFTSVPAMSAWRADVRPVPVSGRDACAVALAQGHTAVVVDLGSVTFVVDGAELEALGGGRVPDSGAPVSAAVPTARLANGWLIEPGEPPAGLAARLTAVLGGEPAIHVAYVFGVRREDGAEPALTAGLVLAGVPDEAELAALATRLATHLAEELAYRTDLDVTVLTPADAERVETVMPPIYTAG